MATTLEEFMPKTAKAPVGEEVLTVAQLTSIKRDMIFRYILEDLNAVEAASAFMSMGDDTDSAEGSDEGKGARFVERLKGNSEGFDKLIASVRKLLEGGLTKIMCIVLDTEKNRKLVFDDPKLVEKVETDNAGCEYSKAMFRWVGNIRWPRPWRGKKTIETSPSSPIR